jgi:hypothetical protein
VALTLTLTLEALGEEAGRRGAVMYVEVGALTLTLTLEPYLGAVVYMKVGAHETEAQGFWRSNGFVPIGESVGDLCADLQRRFYDGACWRFSDTVQVRPAPPGVGTYGDPPRLPVRVRVRVRVRGTPRASVACDIHLEMCRRLPSPPVPPLVGLDLPPTPGI